MLLDYWLYNQYNNDGDIMINEYCVKIRELLEIPIKELEYKVMVKNRKEDRILLELYSKRLYESYIKIEKMLAEDSVYYMNKEDN